jgi:4-diphosphocytidyl-2-C-methyl-D-erythritol kinase
MQKPKVTRVFGAAERTGPAAAERARPVNVARSASLRALAKLNIDLRVLGKRADGYHELRTIFQTISLSDSINLSFTPARRTAISLEDALAIPDNLVTRAAQLAMDFMRATGRVEIRLTKRIPMGAGLGGGSSDAAAILLALPVLAGRVIELPQLLELAQQLGSDVPFFLLGGRAAAIGRGTELFPLPDSPSKHGVLIHPGIHVSTAEAYRLLGASLTSGLQQNKIESFQSQIWGQGCPGTCANDFEGVVFKQHPRLGAIKRKLIRSGASQAMMTGSGSAVFGLFEDRAQAARAAEGFQRPDAPYGFSLVNRVRYQSLWQRALDKHIVGRTWPPRSRYAR